MTQVSAGRRLFVEPPICPGYVKNLSRPAESIKIQPGWADRGEALHLKASASADGSTPKPPPVSSSGPLTVDRIHPDAASLPDTMPEKMTDCVSCQAGRER